MQFRNINFIFFISVFLWVIIVQFAFLALQKNTAKNNLLAINGILRMESEYSNPFLVAKSMQDLESLGLIKCSFISTLQGDRPYLDRSHQEGCKDFNEFYLEGQIVESQVKLTSGKNMNIRFVALNDQFFYIALWSIRVFGILVLTVLYFAAKKRILNLEELYQVEKLSLENFKNITKQVKHDVNSPLSAIKIISDYKGLDPSFKNLLKNSIDRASRIIKDLELNHVSLEIRDFNKWNLKNVVFDVVKEKKSNRIQYFLDDLEFKFNKTEIERVVSNILNNSLEACESSDIKVQLKKSNFNEATLVIQDNGPGYPQEILDGIEQGKSIGKTHGRRLGLFHAKETLKKHNGNLILKNNLGAYTELKIPLSEIPR